MFDIAVIGGGIMGAPAAHALAERGLRVALVASPEPAEPRTHTGPFAAHYDVSRLTSRTHSDPLETALSDRSLEAFEALHAEVGGVIRAYGSLFLTAPGLEEGRLAAAIDGGAQILDAVALRERYDFLHIPDDVVGFVEEGLPDIIDPRHVVATSVSRAVAAGAELFATHAEAIDTTSPFTITLGTEETMAAGRVLVAAGAFSNRPGLLPRPLALRFKREVVALAELSSEEAAALSNYPPLVYQIAETDISNVYSAPPLSYPDGSIRLKWGANTLADAWLQDEGSLHDWYRTGDSNVGGAMIRSHLSAFLPTMSVANWHIDRCAVTYTAHGKPYLDETETPGLFVAVGGNGHSAKWAPILGQLASDLVCGDPWDPAVPRSKFRAVYEVYDGPWMIRDLWSDRASASETSAEDHR